jgi:hypothetical protein
VYIDLLAQANELEQVGEMPTMDADIEAARDGINRSAGKVLRIRRAFQNVLGELMTAYPETRDLIAPEKRESFMRLQPQVNRVGFSDTFVISVPLRENGEAEGAARGASAVFNVVAGVAVLSLFALSEGIPLRGGLQIGPAVELFPGEVYGKPLLDAYRLESQVAVYPRTVVGSGVFRYLGYLEELTADSAFNAYASNKARQCRELFCDAPDDGQPMLHIASRAVVAAAPEFESYRVEAFKWVASQAERFRAEGNNKLADRYDRLARYFQLYL